MAKVLVVEDDLDVADVVRDTLRADNFVVDVANNIRDAKHFLSVSSYDILVLDWELPDGAGVDLCKEVKMTGEPTAILMLTGRSSTNDRVHGLDSGADDYLTKPFETSELLARLRSFMRRLWQKKAESLKIGSLEMEIQTRKVFRDGEEVRLLKKEFELLELLMRNPGDHFSTEYLLDKLWGQDSDAGSDAVFQCIRRLRRKLDKPDGDSLIALDHGFGYRINSQN